MLPRCLYRASDATVTRLLQYKTKTVFGPSSLAFCAPSVLDGQCNHGLHASKPTNIRSRDAMLEKETDINMQASADGLTLTGTDVMVRLTTKLYRHTSNPEEIPTLTIAITEAEKALFHLLKECIAFNSLKLELRIAGGWVRDKLLNISSKDIDIALDTMTGAEFCSYLNAFTDQNLGFHKTVGIVKRRPEQSKHLETATLNILGFDIDFVNLRNEDYVQESRIPVMKIGTPMEDAMQNTIEDFTGKGIDDLNAKIIRTCSPAFGTFLDDPLRVIRAARFSARLGYRLDDEIMVASSHPEVLKQLQNKVARPRIAQELDDMLSRGNVARGFELMKIWGVLHILTKDDHADAPSDDQIHTGCENMRVLGDCLQSVDWGPLNLKVSYLAAFCAPLRGEPDKGRCSYIEHVIKSRLKLPNKLASSACIVVDGGEVFGDIHQLPSDTPSVREIIGSTIRGIGPLWKEALLLAMAIEVLSCPGNQTARISQKYSDLMATIYELKLDDAYSLKAPITGKELMDIIPDLTTGPRFKEALDFQIKQLLRVPSLSKERLLQYVVEKFRTKS